MSKSTSGGGGGGGGSCPPCPPSPTPLTLIIKPHPLCVKYAPAGGENIMFDQTLDFFFRGAGLVRLKLHVGIL